MRKHLLFIKLTACVREKFICLTFPIEEFKLNEHFLDLIFRANFLSGKISGRVFLMRHLKNQDKVVVFLLTLILFFALKMSPYTPLRIIGFAFIHSTTHALPFL